MNDGLATLSFDAGAVEGRDEAAVLVRLASKGRRGVGARERRRILVRSDANNTSNALDIVALWVV
jgi:hypothetical protein